MDLTLRPTTVGLFIMRFHAVSYRMIFAMFYLCDLASYLTSNTMF